MRGSQLARQLVHDHLVAYLNDDIDRLAAAELDIERVMEFHPAWISSNRVTNWPVVMLTARSGVNLGRIDFVDGDPLYQWNWTIRAWVWCRGESYEQTANRAELTATTIVNTLLGRPALGDPADGYSVLPEPMSVSLSDVVLVDEAMTASIAGAYVEAVVTMAETATADPPLGTAEEIAVAAEPLEEP